VTSQAATRSNQYDMRRHLPVLVALALLAAAPSAQDRREGSVRPGDLAPDFSLAPRDGGAAITLSSFRGVKSVALVFGSYT
jgi:hypothetical protein